MKILKTTGCALLLIILAAGTAVLFSARMYMTPDKVMRSMQDALELQLRARMTCGALEVHPLSGCVFRDVELFDTRTDSADPLLRCAEVRFTHSLLPLVLQKLLIREVVVIDPVLAVTGRRAGRRRHAAMTEDRPPLQVHFFPRSLRVRGGRVQFAAVRGPLGLEDIECEARGMSLLGSAPVSLSARIIGDPTADVIGTGRFSLARPTLALDIACTRVVLDGLREHLRSAGIPLDSGLVSFRAVLEWGDDTTGIDVQCELRNASLSLPAAAADGQAASLEMTSLHASAAFKAVRDMPSGAWHLQDISGRLLSAPFTGRASLRTSRAGTRISGTLDMPELRAEELFAHCMSLPVFFPEGLRLEGKLGVRMNIDGMAGVTDLFPEVLLQFHDTRVCYPALARLQPRLNGIVALGADRVSSDVLKIGTDDLWISLAGDVRGYRTKAPRADLRVVSSYMNLAGLFTPDETGDAEPIGPLDFGVLQFQGPVDLGTTYFLGMKLFGVHGAYRFVRNVFEVRDLCGTVGDGRFATGVSIDLGEKGLAYSARLDVDGIALSEALQLVPGAAKQHVGGDLYGSISASGFGSDYYAFLRNLSARADLRIADAAVNLSGMFPQLADVIVGPSLERVSFDSAGLQLDLRNGDVRVRGAFTGQDIGLYPEGMVGLDGSLDLDVHLYIDPEMLSGSEDLAGCLQRDKDMAVVPIAVQGTFNEPRVGICR